MLVWMPATLPIRECMKAAMAVSIGSPWPRSADCVLNPWHSRPLIRVCLRPELRKVFTSAPGPVRPGEESRRSAHSDGHLLSQSATRRTHRSFYVLSAAGIARNRCETARQIANGVLGRAMNYMRVSTDIAHRANRLEAGIRRQRIEVIAC